MVSYSLGSSKSSGLERRGWSERPLFNHGGNLDFLKNLIGFGGVEPPIIRMETRLRGLFKTCLQKI